MRFNGRIVANPNRSGVVQSTIQGRYEAPEGGVPPLGSARQGRRPARTRGARRSPRSTPPTWRRRWATSTRRSRSTARKLARQEQLLADQRRGQGDGRGYAHPARGAREAPPRAAGRQGAPGGAARAGRRRDRRDARGRRPGGRRRATSCSRSSIRRSLLVEALVFDQINPDAVDEATATVGTDAAIKLKFIGRSRALQQQYSILQFQIVEATRRAQRRRARHGDRVERRARNRHRAAACGAGAGAERADGRVQPQGAGGIRAPSRCASRRSTARACWSRAALQPGEKIVVRNAPLLNQVR